MGYSVMIGLTKGELINHMLIHLLTKISL
jgi:hypothetical protein